MKVFLKFAAVAAGFGMVAIPALAQDRALESRLEARKVVVAADGKENLTGADAARPGDVIEYVATYRNTTRSPIRNVVATLPIPQNTELVAGSPRPVGARASLDGRAFAAMPLKRKVVRDGREIEEQVPLREYRALRWSPGPIDAGQSVTYAARVRVLDDGPPAATKGGGK